MPEKRNRNSIFEINEHLEEFEALAKELIGSAFSESPSWNEEACCLHALCNIFITPREVIITADLPNTEPETIKVEALDENNFKVTAKMRKKVQFAEWGIYHRKGEFSFLRCQGRLPVAIDAEKMKISFKRGILEVRFPRKEKYEIEVE